MGIRIQDVIEVSVYLNDVEFPLHSINNLNFIRMDSMVNAVLPTCHFSLTDPTNLIGQERMIHDGSSVRFAIKAIGSSEQQVYSFRVFHFKEPRTPGNVVWEADGYWDAPLYWLGTSAEGIQGTSDYVLSTIAQRCGIEYSGTTTSDAQLWMPQNRSNGEFVRNVVKRGYASDKSLMVQGVGLDGVMRYRDFNIDTPEVKSLVLGKQVSGALPILDFRPHSNAGFNNKLTGYSTVRRAQTVMRQADYTEYNNLNFEPDSRNPLFNQNLKTVQARGYQQYGPIDFGNVHEDYERAVYQNLRYAGLYNLTVDFMSMSFSGLQLFDTFSFTAQEDETAVDQSYSGKYRCSGLNITIEQQTYGEFIRGVRHGTN